MGGMRREIYVRPSSAGRWASEDGCPASATYRTPKGGESETIYTQRGTRIHAAVAHIIDPDNSPKPPKLNDEERETANHMVQLVRDTIDMDAYDWTVERKLGLMVGGVFIDGTPDLVGISKTDIDVPVEIIDFKAGLGVMVQAENNMQLLTYAALVQKGDGEYRRPDGHEIDLPGLKNPGYNVRIVQPSNVMHHEPPVKTAHFRYSQVMDYLQRISALLKELQDDRHIPVHNPTPENCRWCHAKKQCVAFQDTALATIDDSGMRVNEDGDSFKLPVGDWAEFLNRAKIVEQMKDAVEREAERRLREGKIVPGLKLVQTRLGQRKWANEDEACAEMEQWPGGASVMWAPPKIRTPRQAEEEFRKMGDHAAANAISQYVVRTPAIVKIVPTDDPRPEIGVRGAIAHFSKNKARN